MAGAYEHYQEMKDRGIDLAAYEPELYWHNAVIIRLIEIVMTSANMDPLLGRFVQPDWWEVRQAGVGKYATTARPTSRSSCNHTPIFASPMQGR